MVSKLYILVWAEGFHCNYTDLVLGNRSQGEFMFGKKFLSYVCVGVGRGVSSIGEDF